MLNDVISRALITNPPSNYKGGIIDISYGTQIKSSIPSFVLFTNDPKYLHFSYMRYIENKIRSSFNIKNVPILVYYKDKNARIRAEDNSGNKTKRVVRSVNRKTKKYEN
ncbi:hypothetical protein FACS189459_5580 [Bacilli bacterium]|nr:hypothetical protein FACS189459_5580 [Bacilli bacterium]